MISRFFGFFLYERKKTNPELSHLETALPKCHHRSDLRYDKILCKPSLPLRFSWHLSTPSILFQFQSLYTLPINLKLLFNRLYFKTNYVFRAPISLKTKLKSLASPTLIRTLPLFGPTPSALQSSSKIRSWNADPLLAPTKTLYIHQHFL